MMNALHCLPCLTLLVGLAVGSYAQDRRVVSPTRSDYLRIAGEVERNLNQQVLAKWFPASVDDVQGGFHQNYGEAWDRIPNRDRAIVYQSRLTWLAAAAALRYRDRSAEFQKYSLHGERFLEKSLWDSEFGGFYWALGDDGKPERNGEKHAYGISFGIYAAAECYAATRDKSALDLALRAYHWLDAHAHDAQNSGYYEALAREGKPILTPPGADSGGDFIGTRYGYKSMNTHIHLLEALTSLYHVHRTAKLRVRLRELFELVRDRITIAPGYLNLYFTPEWKPVPDHDSFGHDIETAYLLAEATAELGMPDDRKTWSVARSLVDHALTYGWDRDHGGIYDSGVVSGAPISTDKIWWTQAEGMNALLLMHRRFGRETTKYWDAFLRQWEFIQQYQVDQKNGGWYARVAADGKAPSGKVKSDRWTEAYHQGRALLNVSEMLQHLATRTAHAD